MKRVLSTVLALAVMFTMVASCFAFTASATEDVASVGAIGGSIWKEFTTGDMNKVAKLIRQEFNRTSNLRSEMHSGKKYFNYGEPTGEMVHAWVGGAGEYNGVPHGALGCMNQDFTGGTSTCLSAFGQPPQWCCIVVTRAGFEKNEAYTVRDAAASLYAQAGGPNSAWGLPTSNQYWVEEAEGEVLYQQFENGYFRSIDGSDLSAFAGFHYEWDEETDMNYPKSGSEDRPSFANVPVIEDDRPQPIDPNADIDMPADVEVIEDDPATEEPAGEDPAEEDPAEEDPAAEESDGEATESETDGEIAEGEDDLADGENAQAGTASKKVTVIKHNSPFMDFMLNYWWVLVIAGVVVIGGVVAVIVLVSKKKKTAGADAADAPAEKK